MSEQKLPKGALRFVDEGCHANVELVESDGKRMPKLNMVAYSGGIIKGHWYWDNLAIDLDGIEFKQSRYPVLEDHRTDRKVAVIGKPVIKEGKLMAPENAKFLDTEASNEFQKLSGDGFPYQSSIYAKPSNVERIEEGASAKVNGLTMKGPGSIWRKCEFKEMSVCVFGWDSKTKASAFSKEEMEDVEFLEEVTKVKIDDNIKQGKEVKKKMDREELMETYPDLIKGIVEQALSESQTKFDLEKKTLQDQLAAAKQSNAEMSDRVLKLEKKDMLRHEKEQKDLADTIWARKLAASDVPSRIHEKVEQHVGYSKFMKDDVLDVTAFSEAVDAEIKSWESLGTTNAVMGTSQTQKEVDTNAKAEEIKLTENKSIVDRLVQLSGVKVPKKE